MFGYSTLRETWNTRWGPEPVLALSGADERARPVTLPRAGAAPAMHRAAPMPRAAG